MYRFHPSVKWSEGYPNRQQIVSQITQLWKRYGLQEHTKFNTRVTSVTQDRQGRWIINDPSNGRFEGVIPAIGTCGDVSIYTMKPISVLTKTSLKCHIYPTRKTSKARSTIPQCSTAKPPKGKKSSLSGEVLRPLKHSSLLSTLGQPRPQSSRAQRNGSSPGTQLSTASSPSISSAKKPRSPGAPKRY